MSITITVPMGTGIISSFADVPYTSGMNAQNALEAAYSSCGGPAFTVKYFGSLGYEVLGWRHLCADRCLPATATTSWTDRDELRPMEARLAAEQSGEDRCSSTALANYAGSGGGAGSPTAWAATAAATFRASVRPVSVGLTEPTVTNSDWSAQ